MHNRMAKASSTSHDEVEMIWVFTTNNFAESEVISDIFEAEDIAYLKQRMEPSQFYFSIGEHDQIRIAVEEGRLQSARELIHQALEDGAIPGDGNLMDPPLPKE